MFYVVSPGLSKHRNYLIHCVYYFYMQQQLLL